MSEHNMSLNELAARVEALQGPCRETDAAIFRAIDAPLPAEFAGGKIALTFDEARSAFFMEVGDMVVRYEPPKYTDSIDAAMALADAADDPLDILEEALATAREERDGIYFLPLHICAAALKARSLSALGGRSQGEGE